jgi:predicted O-methyltransferase YrrM
MFHTITSGMAKRMRELEEIHLEDADRLRQVPIETGKFLAILAGSAPDGVWFELGTSGGYSAMWISLACRARGTRLITVDYDPKKTTLAKETFEVAGVTDIVEVVNGESLSHLQTYSDCELSFCFIDAGGGIGTYDIVVPKLKPGGLLIYDNVISHAKRARPTVEKAMSDTRVACSCSAPSFAAASRCRERDRPCAA